jgi:hypothetical protein
MTEGLVALPAAERAQRAPAGGAATAFGRGLVHSEQSSRGTDLALSLDPEAASMRRARRVSRRVVTAARLLDERCRRGGFRGRVKFVTLTYRDGGDWRPDHVRRLVNRLRARFERRGQRLHYTWTAELQRRGAIHYHLLLWVPSGGASLLFRQREVNE